MTIGFLNAFKAGISFGKDDLVIPESKEKIITEAKKMVEEYETQYSEGLITKGRRIGSTCER